jgi:ABC-type uncharacterized transport system substrate-binding protein
LHLQLNPDVILAAQTGALTARGVTRTIPIVTIILEDPVVSGFASSIAKPGGNITGTWILGDSALVAKGLDSADLPLTAPRQSDMRR